MAARRRRAGDGAPSTRTSTCWTRTARAIGGTGETFDWELVQLRRTNVPLILSGGLKPENVADAIAATQPFAVDMASGTEAAPGVKDPAKLRAFSEAVDGAEVAA